MLPKDITNSMTDILTASLKDPGDGLPVFSNENDLLSDDQDDDLELQESGNDEMLMVRKIDELAEDDHDVIEIMQDNDWQDVEVRLAVADSSRLAPLQILLKQANFQL